MLTMDPPKKRKGGVEREREKKRKALQEEAAKCSKITDLFRAPTREHVASKLAS